MLKTLSDIMGRIRHVISSTSVIKSPFVLSKSWFGSVTVSENELKGILVKAFPTANNIIIEDISGGCGAMFNIYIESKDFKGMTIVKQHQAVTNALKEQIKQFHGIRIETKVPK